MYLQIHFLILKFQKSILIIWIQAKTLNLFEVTTFPTLILLLFVTFHHNVHFAVIIFQFPIILISIWEHLGVFIRVPVFEIKEVDLWIKFNGQMYLIGFGFLGLCFGDLVDDFEWVIFLFRPSLQVMFILIDWNFIHQLIIFKAFEFFIG